MAQVTAIWDAAVKAGYTLSEEAAEEIDSTIASFETMATANNLRGADGYAAVIYGKGVTASLVRELLERAYIAEEYSADIYESFEYSADEINAYYDENADAFDAISFDYYLVEAEKVEVTETVTDEETGEETEETNEEVTDETMAEAKEEADSLLEAAQSGAAQGALSFAEAVAETMGDEAEATEIKSLFGYSVTSGYGVMAEWLLDSAREPGDMAVLENEGVGYYVVCFNSRSDNSDYNGVAFRHILVNVEDEDEDGEFSEEEIEAAEQKIQEIRDEWISDGETEDAFAALANANSDDTGSNGSSLYSTEGGLYEHVAKDQMVEPINDWIFDDARQSGDSEIIYVESSNYTGYHLVYFVGEDGYSYHDCLALYGPRLHERPAGPAPARLRGLAERAHRPVPRERQRLRELVREGVSPAHYSTDSALTGLAAGEGFAHFIAPPRRGKSEDFGGIAMPERTIRTRMLLGQAAMDRLARARVAVVGLGGVGSWCAEALCRAGVGRPHAD